MTKPVFTWSPDVGSERQITPNVESISFGDGYELRVAKGINTMPRMWNVTFSAPTVQGLAILAFLEARKGMESFRWTDPLNFTGLFVCKEFRHRRKGFGEYEITASFKQVFEYE